MACWPARLFVGHGLRVGWLDRPGLLFRDEPSDTMATLPCTTTYEPSAFTLAQSLSNWNIVVAPLALVAGSYKLPESPRFLLKQDRATEALALLRRLHHSPDDPNDVMAREECAQITNQLRVDALMPQGVFAILKVPSYRKRLLLGVFVQ